MGRREPRRRWLEVILAVSLMATGLGGCAWRTGVTEHYFGPVLFRYSAPRDDRAVATEVVSVGVLGEMGRQWGASVGVVDRVTVAPRYVGEAQADEAASHPRWSRPLSPLGPPAADRWSFSLLYLRVDGVQPPALVARRLYGAQIVAGPEARAASVGIISQMTVQPPDDAISIVRFDARAPLESRFFVWHAKDGSPLPVTDILKEADR